jgi:hypothetical protein
MPRPHLTPGKDPVPIVQKAGWASGPVWTGAENLARTGIQSPDRPASRQSLYRLSYLTHQKMFVFHKKYTYILFVLLEVILCCYYWYFVSV